MSCALTQRPVAPDPKSSRTGGPEQRRWPRVKSQRTLVIHPLRAGLTDAAIKARSHDFSTMGLGLVMTRPMRKGDQFLVPLKPRSGPPVPLLYSVVRCRRLGPNQFHIGATLVSVLELEEFMNSRPPNQSVAQHISNSAYLDVEQERDAS